MRNVSGARRSSIMAGAIIYCVFAGRARSHHIRASDRATLYNLANARRLHDAEDNRGVDSRYCPIEF